MPAPSLFAILWQTLSPGRPFSALTARDYLHIVAIRYR